MRDLWHEITTWVDYNRGTFCGALLAVVFLAGAWVAPGCLEPKTPSLKDPAIRVTEAQLLIEARGLKDGLLVKMSHLSAELDGVEKEVRLLETRTDLGLADIEQQRTALVEVLKTLEGISVQAASGALNPMALIPTAFGLAGVLFGVGRGYDNKRKDQVIADLKSG